MRWTRAVSTPAMLAEVYILLPFLIALGLAPALAMVSPIFTKPAPQAAITSKRRHSERTRRWWRSDLDAVGGKWSRRDIQRDAGHDYLDSGNMGTLAHDIGTRDALPLEGRCQARGPAASTMA